MLAQRTSFGTNRQAATGSANQYSPGQSLRCPTPLASVPEYALIDYVPSSRSSPSEDRLLLDELTHRVSNELASAIGIVTAAAARSSATEVKVALGRVRERLESWARVQLALQMPDYDTADRRLHLSAATLPRAGALAIELAGDRVERGRRAPEVTFRAVLADGSHRRRARHEFRAPCIFRERWHH